jgi:hypothetical protein
MHLADCLHDSDGICRRLVAGLDRFLIRRRVSLAKFLARRWRLASVRRSLVAHCFDLVLPGLGGGFFGAGPIDVGW